MSLWDTMTDLIKDVHKDQPWTECVYPFYCDEEAPLVSPPPAPVYGPWEKEGEFYNVEWPCEQWKAQVLWDSAAKRFSVVHYVHKVSGQELWTVYLATNPEIYGSDLYTPAVHNAKYPDMPVVDYTGDNNPTGCYTAMEGPNEDPIIHAPVIGIPEEDLPEGWENWKQPGDDPDYSWLGGYKMSDEDGEIKIEKVAPTGAQPAGTAPANITKAGLPKWAVIALAVIAAGGIYTVVKGRKTKKRGKKKRKR